MKIGAEDTIRRIALSVVALSLCVLLINAATTCVWCDEIRGYFLSCRPLPELLGLMASNVHEDPPLYDILLHCWLPVSGYDPLLLRLPSLGYWALALGGLFVAARRMGGSKSGWCTLIVAALMPCHWLLPAALRWFSLFACLAVWNFVSFLTLWEEACGAADRPGRGPGHSPGRGKTVLLGAAGYVATGAGMWYTNYCAPGIFFCHLLICLAWAGHKRHLATWLAASFAAIGLLYLPWLPTFFRQLSASTMQMSNPLVVGGLSLYSLWAGEFSTPFAWWISIPAGITALLGTALVLVHFRRVRLPLLIFVVTVSALWITQTIWTLRMLIVSPFLALCLGLSLAAAWDRNARWLIGLRWSFLLSATILLVGSFTNMVTREGWFGYRWLDPIAATIQSVRSNQPDALVMTNSEVVLFYSQDHLEPAGATGDFQRDTLAYAPAVVNYPIDEWLREAADRAIGRAERIAFIHHSAYGGPFSGVSSEVNEDLKTRGFLPAGTESALEMSPLFLRHSPKLNDTGLGKLDTSRVVVAYFARPKGS